MTVSEIDEAKYIIHNFSIPYIQHQPFLSIAGFRVFEYCLHIVGTLWHKKLCLHKFMTSYNYESDKIALHRIERTKRLSTFFILNIPACLHGTTAVFHAGPGPIGELDTVIKICP